MRSMLSPEDVQRRWDACVREGRAAWKLGVRLRECPPFRDLDMAASWRMGWWQENNDEKRRSRHGLNPQERGGKLR